MTTSKIELYRNKDIEIDYKKFADHIRIYTKFNWDAEDFKIESRVPLTFTKARMIEYAIEQINEFCERYDNG